MRVIRVTIVQASRVAPPPLGHDRTVSVPFFRSPAFGLRCDSLRDRVEGDEMGGACSWHVRDGQCVQDVKTKCLKRTANLQEQGIDDSIMLR